VFNFELLHVDISSVSDELLCLSHQMSLSPSPTVKHTGQESASELSKIFKFWSFLQWKYANNICKLLQLLYPRPTEL